jgi:hypothetical protein
MVNATAEERPFPGIEAFLSNEIAEYGELANSLQLQTRRTVKNTVTDFEK